LDDIVTSEWMLSADLPNDDVFYKKYPWKVELGNCHWNQTQPQLDFGRTNRKKIEAAAEGIEEPLVGKKSPDWSRERTKRGDWLLQNFAESARWQVESGNFERKTRHRRNALQENRRSYCKESVSKQK